MGILRATWVMLCWAGAAGAECSPTSLDIRTITGTISRFNVEVADDDAERATGLMNRERLPTAAGMLFVYPRPGRVAFWMENTLIPLDMIFADATGTVTRIHSNAIPGDLTAIDGGDGVALVLEINGGLAETLQIPLGAEIRHPSVDQAQAAWPCDG